MPLNLDAPMMAWPGIQATANLSVVSGLTWEQKMAACKALAENISLRMRKPGDWYVDHRGVEITDGVIASSGCVGATTPEGAVEQHWDFLTTLQEGERVVVNGLSEDRREYRWDDFMWAPWN